MSDKLTKSYAIVDRAKTKHGLWTAAPGEQYQRVWLRDCYYISLVFRDKDCDTYEKAYHTILDIFKKHEDKLTYHTQVKPKYKHEYIHPRYTADTLEEIDQEFGNCQHDAIGSVLYGIGEGIRVGKKIIRDEHDKNIIQKIVYYLQCCEYWKDLSHGVWEETPSVDSSVLAAVIAGLESVRDIVFVSQDLIDKGREVLMGLFPKENINRDVDLAQLSLVFPYKVVCDKDARIIVERVERELVRERGAIRYHSDSYFVVPEHERRFDNPELYIGKEAEWCFAYPWLSLCFQYLGDTDKAKYYLDKSESVMLEDGSLPELYIGGTDKWNENSPLIWGQAKYILAKEGYNKIINN